jgi:hypothetical protein
MKKLLIVVAIVCLFCPQLLAQQATAARGTNVRPTASTDQQPVAHLSSGDTVTLLSTTKKNGYFHIETVARKKGWAWAKNLTIGGGGALLSVPASPPAPSFAPGTEAVDDPSCPAEGKTSRTGAAKQDDELRNKAKRFIANNTPAVLLSLPDFKALQADTDTDAVDHVHKVLPRNLTGKHAGSHTVSEGERVSVTGFLHRAENGSAAESVNCAGNDGKDIHLNINTPKPTSTFNEWTGIVVEVIPQVPLPGWTQQERSKVVSALQAVRDAKLPVLAVGSLTYDNEHQVNSDKNNPKGSNPKRMSLWEVHPVLEFYVCPKTKTCDPATPNTTWETLKVWRTNNRQ